MIPRPLLQKREHPETAASDGTHFREFEDDNPGVCLRVTASRNLISGFSLYNSALAAYDSQFTYVCDGYIQHDFLPALAAQHCSAHTRARAIPFVYFVQDESLLSRWHSDS